MPKILVGMGGGAGSTLTAALLKAQGEDVQAVYLRFDATNPQVKATYPMCLDPQGQDRAERSAKALGIDLQVIDVGGLFEERVVDPWLADTIDFAGLPPCHRCLPELVIPSLLKAAESRRIDRVGLGLFARVMVNASGVSLMRALDADYDQSALLARLPANSLSKLVTPLGELLAKHLTKLQSQLDLPKDIRPLRKSRCWQESETRAQMVEAYAAPTLRPAGTFHSLQDHVMGNHKGRHHYQVGDPVSLEGQDSPQTWVVLGSENSHHVLAIGPKESLLKSRAVFVDCHWQKPVDLLKATHCEIMAVSAGGRARASLIPYDQNQIQAFLDGEGLGLFRGEQVLFLDGDEVLGTGRVERTEWKGA